MKKTALITGGSSGLGYSLSEELAGEGYRILWASKPADEIKRASKKLQEKYPEVELHATSIDLVEDQATDQLLDWIDQLGFEPDIVVNNAGFGSYGYLLETNAEKELNMMHLHMQVVYLLSRQFLERMEAKGGGLIINICSNSAFQPVPLFTTYAATKAFVLHFTRAVNEEQKMKGAKARLMAVCPAALNDTPFQQRAKMDRVKTFQGIAATSRTEVARDILKGIKSGKSLVVSGWKMRLLYLFDGLMPYWLRMRIVRSEVVEHN